MTSSQSCINTFTIHIVLQYFLLSIIVVCCFVEHFSLSIYMYLHSIYLQKVYKNRKMFLNCEAFCYSFFKEMLVFYFKEYCSSIIVMFVIFPLRTLGIQSLAAKLNLTLNNNNPAGRNFPFEKSYFSSKRLPTYLRLTKHKAQVCCML